MIFGPYGFQIGSFPEIRYYGIIVMLGVVVGGFVARRMLGRMAPKLDPDLVWDGLLWAVIFGVIGARLYHIFTPSQSLLDAGIDTAYYLTHPIDAINIRAGGLGIPGAIIGGIIGLTLFARRRRLNPLLVLDAAAPGLALGHAIGRWGNYVNQELYGPPTDLPWAIFIRPENRLIGYEIYETFHPLFAYEALWNLGVAIALILIYDRFRARLITGDIFLMYLVAYPFGRFLLEFIRLDYVPLFGLNFNQIAMLLVAFGSLMALIYRHWRQRASAFA